jgi:SPP1 gp7 family putative phage head morphogenesis protein
MNSKLYWRKRETEQKNKYITDEVEYEKRIKKIYSDVLDNVQKEIDAFYGKYAKAEGITIAEAKKRVSELDIKRYERKAKRYVEEKNFSKEANAEMRLYNATMKINRLEMLKANIGLELISGHDELQKYMEGILKGRTEEELKRQAGILGKTIKNNAQTADAIVNASFHNAKFSDRVWMYQDLLKAELSKLLQSGLIQGKNPRVLAKEIRNKFDVSKSNAERLMRTELARVQTEAQKQSYERNGFTQYTFHALGDACPICRVLNGKHFKVKDMMPGENAAPVHPSCRCSTSAYEDSDIYEAWLEYLANGGTTETWDNLKHEKPQYLRNNLPKFYKDNRNVGKEISKDDLNEVIEFAKSKGVQIGVEGKKTGGFENYCGDIKVIKNIIEEVSRQQESYLYKKYSVKNTILLYDNVLGYEGDKSKIDVDAFAETRGRTITLNKFMFDDSEYLKKEYKNAESAGFFVKGTDYRNIISHEVGHIIEKNNPSLYNKMINVFEEQANSMNMDLDMYIKKNISIYAGNAGQDNKFNVHYNELIAEVNSLLSYNEKNDIIKLIRKEGVF